MPAISLPATLQCDGHKSMLISSPIFKILPISLNIWSRMSCIVRLFPELMLCTELRESVEQVLGLKVKKLLIPYGKK